METTLEPAWMTGSLDCEKEYAETNKIMCSKIILIAILHFTNELISLINAILLQFILSL